ncbi:hypothetical protein FT641_19375 [Bacillus paranthracis]|uniref:hypothetical protein n=1 Tax=Bacillus paranthracis TaxID=2026186 RepID=UPI00187B063B|nr:hypothetical protein [Bacillus paranthracis]MBE7114273.1 hypothetical protein [Bacillus paranthracis]MBE7154854.1 hypothetical protein [Bacillus paranthracis]
MKYGFQYHGEVDELKVFMVKKDDERGLRQVGVDVTYEYYTLDHEGTIEKIWHINPVVGKCNATTIEVAGTVIPSKATQVTVSKAERVLNSLKVNKTYLDGVGRVDELDFDIITHYLFEIEYKKGHKSLHYYSGTDLHDAMRVAQVNNPALVGIRLHDGDMTGYRGY